MNEEQWEVVEKTLPGGFRMVGTVDRPNGDVYDLGQNAEGQFRLFRRQTGPFHFYSHGKPEVLSDIDLAGFGLQRWQSFDPRMYDPLRAQEEGEYSSLCKSHLLKPS